MNSFVILTYEASNLIVMPYRIVYINLCIRNCTMYLLNILTDPEGVRSPILTPCFTDEETEV